MEEDRMSRRMLGVSMALALAAVQPLAAQNRPRIELIPQAGYMVFGNHWSGPIGTDLANANGAFYALQLGLNLTPNVAIIGSVGQARTDLTVGLPFLGGVSVGRSETLLYDAGLQLRFPMGEQGRGVSPFIQGGVGGAHYRLENGILDVTSNSPAFHVGAGVDLDLSPNIGLRLQARDYIGRFDFEEAVQFNLRSETTHNLALTAGLRVGF
jgi:opacity protein-like surface antigen